MLTQEQGIVEFEKGRVIPDRLIQNRHGRYLGHAERMLGLYKEGIGKTRQELHRGVHQLLDDEAECPTRRIDAFCKLLDDASEFDRDAGGSAAKLRKRIFRMAAPYHPLVKEKDRLFETSESDVKGRIAAELGLPWDEIEKKLFADVMELHRLKEFPGYPDARTLLSRYNVAQVQVALYRASKMTVWAREDFKTILCYAKMANLLHTIFFEPASHEYRIELDGPASILRETRRYGVAMAKLVPVLLACRNWRMRADIKWNRGGWKSRFELSPKDGLQSHLPEPEEFDSNIEAVFTRKWGDQPREGWTLIREGEILHRHQKVFVPDFTLRHEDGRSVLLEIVGFWTPEYLNAKFDTLKMFPEKNILLAVSRAGAANLDQSFNAIIFKTALKVKDVLARLAEL
jgi:predicted nuclease of restriction endonuclease-like RecB superfamily